MGLCIQLADERSAALDVVTDDANVLHRLLPRIDDDSRPMLSSIDLYGDTVFNALQMKRFLAEWDDIMQRARSPEERMLTAAVKKLAERCRDEVHLYLKFIGD